MPKTNIEIENNTTMRFKKVHSDERGDIYILTGFLNYPEVTLFKTNAGYARGGCIHNKNDEHICVLEGTVDYAFGNKNNNKVHKIRLNDGETSKILKGTPHYFYSITDSTVLEFGALPEEKKEKYKSFRDIVDNINKNRNLKLEKEEK